MAEITSIEPQKKDKTRCNVYVDGRFYCGIKLEVAIKFHLKAGMQIERSRLDEIQLETEKSQALDKAMTHISASMKTKKQIQDFLVKKGYTQAVTDFVLERLEYYSLVDDYAYCRAYVQNVKGKGKRALENDLKKRGADLQAIDSVLGDVTEDADEVIDLLKKYMRSKEYTKENLYKGFRYLLSKGYDYETVKAAMDALGETDADY